MIMRRFGRPGLLGLAARTAVVAGTASMTAGAINRHAQDRANEQAEAAAYEQQAVPTQSQPTAVGGSMVDEIQRLATLHQQGALSDTEFAAAKQRLLG
jgi:hypothetical protein